MANTMLLQKKRMMPGSPTSSTKTIMCTPMTYLKQSLVRTMVLLGLIDHGRVFGSEINRSDLDGLNQTKNGFQVTAKKMKVSMTPGKQPALVHMPTGPSLDYRLVVH
jgi:hypothetical protein